VNGIRGGKGSKTLMATGDCTPIVEKKILKEEEKRDSILQGKKGDNHLKT